MLSYKSLEIKDKKHYRKLVKLLILRILELQNKQIQV